MSRVNGKRKQTVKLAKKSIVHTADDRMLTSCGEVWRGYTSDGRTDIKLEVVESPSDASCILCRARWGYLTASEREAIKRLQK